MRDETNSWCRCVGILPPCAWRRAREQAGARAMESIRKARATPTPPDGGEAGR